MPKTITRGKSLVRRLIVYFSLAGIIGITLLSLTRYVGWNLLLELASHFQRQYLMASLCLLAVLVLTRQKKLLLIGLFCLAIILTEIVPWYMPQPRAAQVKEGNLRILSSNLYPYNKSYAKVLALVRETRPDVAVFMEVTNSWLKQLDTLSDILPYSTSETLPYLGMVIRSRIPLENESASFFGTDETSESRRASILGSLTISEQTVSLVATHPAPPVGPSIFASRNRQLEQVSQYIQQLHTPVVLVGDLNITMWSPYYRKLVNETGLRNAREGRGILPTWATRIESFKIPPALFWLIAIPIDHCLISPELTVMGIWTGPNIGSDHLPLITDLAIAADYKP